jgi:hypothetical protein
VDLTLRLLRFRIGGQATQPPNSCELLSDPTPISRLRGLSPNFPVGACFCSTWAYKQ